MACDCEIAQRTYCALAQLIPREEMQQIAIMCRICNKVWYGVPEDDDEF